MNGPPSIWIDRLRQPNCYPHPVGNIEIIETHISWIVLTGLRAYKIKKPVNMGFVDFSTLARREACCHAEIQLNRRFATELYLDVVPITGGESSPKMAGSGPAFEYAVMMKQFSQENLLSNLINRQGLSCTQLDRLARRIARFHQEIEIARQSQPWGEPKSVYQPVIENFTILQSLSHHQDQVQRLAEWSEQTYLARIEDFQWRKAGGFIRECHGDLHLGNLFLWGEEVVPFDGIEFNPALRWIDVLSEIAFLVMDLADRGHSRDAHRVLNAYLEETCDYTGVKVLRYYLVYRALVRAKVAAIRLRQQTEQPLADRKQQQEFAAYLDLAEQYTKPNPVKLMITHGLSGSGKTTGSWEIIEQTGAIRIRSDILRKQLLGIPTTRSDSDQSALYSAEATEQTYLKLYELASCLLDESYSVIVDATFLQQHQRDRFRKLAGMKNVPFEILHFDAPKEILLQRVAERTRLGNDASDADVHVVHLQLENLQPLTDEERAYVRLMNAERN